MNNKIIASLSIYPISIHISYPAPIHTAAVNTLLYTSPTTWVINGASPYLNPTELRPKKSLLSIGITVLIEISTFTITLFTLFKQKNN